MSNKKGHREKFPEEFIRGGYDRIRRRVIENVHHILCKARREEYNVEHPDNKNRINKTIHDEYHRLFGVMTPQEVIERVLYVVGKVLKPRSYSLLEKFCTMDERDCYVEGVVR